MTWPYPALAVLIRGLGSKHMVGSGTRQPANRFRRGVALTIINLALQERIALLAERQARYRQTIQPEAIAAWQVKAFNEVWATATSRFRFYAEWQRRHGLPDRIASIRELERFPVLTPEAIQSSLPDIVSDAGPCYLIRTGGTTGRPRSFPRAKSDLKFIYSNMYMARSWSGIRPGDNIVMIWGHDHLFGQGAKGIWNRRKRLIMDWMIGTLRLSVYRLDAESVGRYVNAIRARPGAVLIGYASALRRVLDHMERVRENAGQTGVRAVIFCAETTAQKDLDRATQLLGCPALVEYGLQEVGVVAYSNVVSSTLTVLWDAFHCSAAGSGELLITTLQPLRFPLINYATGDRVQGPNPVVPFRFDRILGRTSDIIDLSLRGGRHVQIHPDLLEDVLDSIPLVKGYAFCQSGPRLTIRVMGPGASMLNAVRTRFIAEIHRELPHLDESTITFSAMNEVARTVSGKRAVVIADPGIAGDEGCAGSA